jgi:hypothetical protein
MVYSGWRGGEGLAFGRERGRGSGGGGRVGALPGWGAGFGGWVLGVGFFRLAVWGGDGGFGFEGW